MHVLDTHFHPLLLRKMLLHGQLTRRQIGEAFGVSMPAVTRHAKWLLDNNLVRSEPVRVAGVKRPVEVFRLREDRATGVAISVEPDQLGVELVGADGSCLATFEQPVEEDIRRERVTDSNQGDGESPPPFSTAGLIVRQTGRQLHILDALRGAIRKATERAAAIGRAIEVVGLCVQGYVEPLSGMIFGMHGVADWEPCLPGQVVNELRSVNLLARTNVGCKVYGLAQARQVDHRIGYVEYVDGALAVASLVDGNLFMGRFGTPSSSVHQRVSGDAERCFCGQTGCLDVHLRRGDATAEMVLAALPGILRQMDVDILGLECAATDWDRVRAACDVVDVAVHVGGDGAQLMRRGLRMACARAMLEQIVQSVRPMVFRRVVAPEALRRTHCAPQLTYLKPKADRSSRRRVMSP